jgi:hypothetical protein
MPRERPKVRGMPHLPWSSSPISTTFVGSAHPTAISANDVFVGFNRPFICVMMRSWTQKWAHIRRETSPNARLTDRSGFYRHGDRSGDRGRSLGCRICGGTRLTVARVFVANSISRNLRCCPQNCVVGNPRQIYGGSRPPSPQLPSAFQAYRLGLRGQSC